MQPRRGHFVGLALHRLGQNVERLAGFNARILVDDGIHRAVEQQRLGALRKLMPQFAACRLPSAFAGYNLYRLRLGAAAAAGSVIAIA